MKIENRAVEFSKKQIEYIKKANRRWNGKVGATRSGKTTLDIKFTIMNRIVELASKPGLIFILGVSKGTITRNVIEPMQEIWGNLMVRDINSNNISFICGQKVYCIGAEKASQVSKIQGGGVKYCYCDEMAEYSEEVFNMLKSRLSFSYSICDFTCNPANQNHFLKKFIDNPEIDGFFQSYQIYDNPFLPKKFIESLENEYRGTVFFDRYILGLWKNAEGLCFPRFADNPNDYILRELPQYMKYIRVGVDFGGNGSASAFVATANIGGFDTILVLAEEEIKGIITPDTLNKGFIKFCRYIQDTFKVLPRVRCDSAEQYLIAGMKNASVVDGLYVDIRNAMKKKINTRIQFVNRMLGSGRLKIMGNCKILIKALQEASYDKDGVRLDNGSFNNDIIDAFEYSIEEDIEKYTDKGDLNYATFGTSK